VAKAYYSTVFEQSADDVWSVIRDFNNYPVWVDGAGESEIEGGKSGDSVGTIRNVLYNGNRKQQKLPALSDVERSQTYEFAGEAPLPVQNFQATLRVTPVVDGDRAFVEWWATSRLRARPARGADRVLPRRVCGVAGVAAAASLFTSPPEAGRRKRRSYRLRHLAQLEFLYLPRARLRDLREHHIARDLVAGEVLLAPLQQLVGARGRARL
jgi:hypothetical protein